MDAYSNLRPIRETKEQFLEYFQSGSNITDAMKQHEISLNNTYNIKPSSLDIANAQKNPKYRTIKYWYENWRMDKYGPKSGPGTIEVRT